uniref:Uncharacterized protein n=1 Tax=Anguilla anguilla TaxID=7936 RepID=A0A0E9WFX1_ANGAN
MFSAGKLACLSLVLTQSNINCIGMCTSLWHRLSQE